MTTIFVFISFLISRRIYFREILKRPASYNLFIRETKIAFFSDIRLPRVYIFVPALATGEEQPYLHKAFIQGTRRMHKSKISMRELFGPGIRIY